MSERKMNGEGEKEERIDQIEKKKFLP